MKFSTFATALYLAATAIAIPMNAPIRRDADPGAVAILEKIAPQSTSCDNAPAAGECATAAQAAQPIIDTFIKYQVTTAGEQVALLAWMAYESGEFKYKINHFPGTPGQGTRCMMSPTFVGKYASAIGVTGSSPADILTNVNAAPDGEWGSAAWFLTTQCSADIRKGLQAGASKAAYEAFLTSCVQTSTNSQRDAYWTAAVTAFGGTPSA